MIKKVLFMIGIFIALVSCEFPSSRTIKSDLKVQEGSEKKAIEEKSDPKKSIETIKSKDKDIVLQQTFSEKDSLIGEVINGHTIVTNPPNSEEEILKEFNENPIEISSCTTLSVGLEAPLVNMKGSSDKIPRTLELFKGNLELETTQERVNFIHALKWKEGRPLKLEIIQYPEDYSEVERQGKFYLRVTLNFQNLVQSKPLNPKIQLYDQSSDKVVKECSLPLEYFNFSNQEKGICIREFEFGDESREWINFIRPAAEVYSKNPDAGYLVVRFVDGSEIMNWHIYKSGSGLRTFSDIVKYYDEIMQNL